MNDSDIKAKALEEQITKSLEGMSSDEIRDVFIESMIFEKTQDDDEVDEEVVKELKADLNDRLDIRINEKLVAALPEEGVNKLDSMIDSGASADEIRAMLEQNGVEVDKVVTEAMQELRDEFIGAEADNEEE